MRRNLLYPFLTAPAPLPGGAGFTVLWPGGASAFSPEEIAEGDEDLLFFATRGPEWPGITDWCEGYEQTDFANVTNLTTDIDLVGGLMSFESGDMADLSSGVPLKENLVRPGEVTVRCGVLSSKEASSGSVFEASGNAETEVTNYLWRFTVTVSTTSYVEMLVEHDSGTNVAATWIIPRPRRDRLYSYSFSRNDAGDSQFYVNGYRCGKIGTLTGRAADDGEGNVSGMHSTGGSESLLKLGTTSTNIGIGFASISAAQTNQAAERAFLDDLGVDFSTREKELFLYDDLASIAASPGVVAVFSPDDSAEGLTELVGTVAPGDFASTNAAQKFLGELYWLDDTNHLIDPLAALALTSNLVIEAIVMYIGSSLIIRAEASGETADTDYAYDLRIESTGFAYFQETDGGKNIDIDFVLPDDRPLQAGEVFKVRLIREDIGGGLGRIALEVLRNDELSWQRLAVSTFSDATNLVANNPSSRTIDVQLPTDSSNVQCRISDGTSIIRYVALFDEATIGNTLTGVTLYTSYSALMTALAGEHSEGDLVGLSWDADSFVQAGFVYGEVQADGSIDPPLLSLEMGVPLKILDLEYETLEGDEISLNGDGYPEADTTALTQFSRMGFKNLYARGATDLRLYTTTNLTGATIPNDAVNYIFGARCDREGRGYGWLEAFFRKTSNAIYTNILMDDGDTSSNASIDSAVDFLEDREMELHLTHSNTTSLPSVSGGGGSIAPTIDIVSRSDSWEHRHGYYDVASRLPSSKLEFTCFDDSIAGEGTVTLTRVCVKGDDVQIGLNPQTYSTIVEAYAAAPSLAVGTEVVVAWDADSYTSAGEVRGVVGKDGKIFPELWAHEEGIPFPALGASLTNFDGDGIPLVGGYPQIDNSSIAAATEMHFDGLFSGVTLFEMHADLQVPVMTETGGSSSLLGIQVRPQGSATSDTPTRLSSYLVYFSGVREGYNRDGSFSTNTIEVNTAYADDRVIKLLYETTTNTAYPAFKAGFDSVSPEVDNANVTGSWSTSNGKWDTEEGYPAKLGFYVNPGASVGNGTITFTRVRMVGHVIELEDNS